MGWTWPSGALSLSLGRRAPGASASTSRSVAVPRCACAACRGSGGFALVLLVGFSMPFHSDGSQGSASGSFPFCLNMASCDLSPLFTAVRSRIWAGQPFFLLAFHSAARDRLTDCAAFSLVTCSLSSLPLPVTVSSVFLLKIFHFSSFWVPFPHCTLCTSFNLLKMTHMLVSRPFL